MIFRYIETGATTLGKFLDDKCIHWGHGEYIIEVKKNRPVRSLNHNRYYFAVLKSISIHTGEDKDTLHELFKIMFNYTERTFKNGFTARQPLSTSNLDKHEFTIYIEKVKKFAEQEWGHVFVDYENFDYYSEQSVNEEYSNTFNRI